MTSRIEKLQLKMKEENLPSLLITNLKNIFYLTGFWGSFGAVLITPNRRIFFTDYRYILLAKSKVKDFEIEVIKGDLAGTVAKILRLENITEIGFEDEISFSEFKQFETTFLPTNLRPVSRWVEDLRLIKDEEEIATIKKACSISDKAFLDVLEFIKPGKTEKEVANFLDFRMRELGGEGNAFDMIVVSGERSSMPHGVPSDKVIENGNAVTMDFGTLYHHYVSDMTRTIFVGHVTDEQQKVYDTVLTANKKLIESTKAGMTYADYDKVPRDIIKAAEYGDYFTHGIGHGIGLDVHEYPYFSQEGLLKPGMVITDEPGIYLDNKFGVRIEDDLIVTDSGCELITFAPKELIII